jgi:23S rRNA (uracil1939-C5)-methyltransferase
MSMRRTRSRPRPAAVDREVRDAEMSIESIAAGGDGVGRVDGMVVFVPRTAPGDRVVARIGVRKGFARGTVTTMLESSPLRVEPPCAHYRVDRCGGCQLQHIGYEAQVAAKATVIRDAIGRMGRRTIETPAVEPSPAQWRYRNKLTLALRRRGDRWVAGLHPYDDPSTVFALDDCPITDAAVLSVWRAIMAESDLLPRVAELRGAVRMMDGEPPAGTLVIEGGDRWPERETFFARVPAVRALWWVPEGRSRMLVGRRPHTEEDRRSGDLDVGASFAQVNPVVAALLRTHVLSLISRHAPATVVDAYAGVGDTAAALSADGMRVTAVELDEAAAARCGERLAPPSRVITGSVEDHLAGALPADAVIVNPPRTGLDARVSATLDAATPAPRVLVYVSCNPATLGRDLARLPAYALASVRGFDMFPQTAHVETVCELVRQGEAA